MCRGATGFCKCCTGLLSYASNLTHFAGLGAPRVPPEIEVD